MAEIYLDIVFAVNLGMDWLILWVTATCLKLPYSHWRLLLGALIGSLYAVVILFPPLAILTAAGIKLFFSLVMVGIAFAWNSTRFFLKTLVTFYLVSFIAGGGIVGAIYLLQGSNFLAVYNGVLFLANLPIFWLLPGILILLLVGYLGAFLFSKHLLKANYSVSTSVYFEENCISTTGLVDTGNHLREPFSKRPVIIMEASLLADLLPNGVNSWHQVQGIEEMEFLLTKLKGTFWETRIRLLPFSSLGAKDGMLLGLIPDEVHIKTDEKTIKKYNSIIGVYPGTLSTERGYRALLHPELLETEMDLRKGVAS